MAFEGNNEPNNWGVTYQGEAGGGRAPSWLAVAKLQRDLITEEIHALNLLNMYLDQFKRGRRYTAVYLLRDRTDEAGNQSFGFFKPDHTPRKAAVYLHNLTTILADRGWLARIGRPNYSFSEQPATVHDLLLQKTDGTFELIVWNKQVTGSCSITLGLGGARESVRVYDPTVGTSPTQTLTNVDSIRLSLSDHPVVIELRNDR